MSFRGGDQNQIWLKIYLDHCDTVDQLYEWLKLALTSVDDAQIGHHISTALSIVGDIHDLAAHAGVANLTEAIETFMKIEIKE